jgi:uncharacterized protein
MTVTRIRRVWRLGALAWVLFLVGLLLVPREAFAFTPPTPQGAVTDTSGRLTADDDRFLEQHIAAYRARTTNDLGVLVVGSLGDETVDDVAYTTFNKWGVGKKGPDNGVLLVIAPNERKMRIETGKGVGDRLTDLESSHILRERVGPLLKQERFRDAILAGLVGIEDALDGAGGVAASTSTPKAPVKTPVKPVRKTTLGDISLFSWCFLGGVFFIVVLFIRALIWGDRRRSSRSSYSSGSYSSGDSYSPGSSSSSSDSSWSGGSSGGSDWGGGGSSGGSDFGGGGGGSDFGGGSSGGGGSSDSY